MLHVSKLIVADKLNTFLNHDICQHGGLMSRQDISSMQVEKEGEVDSTCVCTK